MAKNASRPQIGPFHYCVVQSTPDVVSVSASGEIDLSTRVQLQTALAPLLAGERSLLLDLSRISFIDCAGLRVLQAARLAQPRFAIVQPSSAVTRLLKLSGAQVPVFATAAQALSVLATGPPR